MKKRTILLILVIFALTSTIASAKYARPGDMLPLKLTDYKFKTSNLLIPIDAWRPTHLRWMLNNPHGQTVYFVDGGCDQVSKITSYYDGAAYVTEWSVYDDKGLIKIPAFAEEGTWTLSVRFYDKLFNIIDFHKDTDVLYSFEVGDIQFYEQLNGPMYFTFGIPFLGDFAFATPDLIILLGFVVVIVIILINVKAFLSRRKKNVKTS